STHSLAHSPLPHLLRHAHLRLRRSRIIAIASRVHIFLLRAADPRDLHSFPTRRSSDLERQKQPYGRQHTYHHYRTQRPAYEKTESLPRAWCGYPSAYGSQALGIEKE